MVGAEPSQLPLDVVDLAVERVDQAQARLDRARPGLGQSEPRQQLAAAHAEQIAIERASLRLVRTVQKPRKKTESPADE